MVFGPALIRDSEERYACDFCILATNSRELSALLNLVKDVSKLDGAEYPLYSVRIPSLADSTQSDLTGLIMSTNAVGRVEAAIATSLLLRTATPRWLLLVGIAGGIPANDVALGDVLIATRIIDYEYQRLADIQPERRLRVYSASESLLKASGLISTGTWSERFLRADGTYPIAHLGPVLSGDKVIASTAASLALLDIDVAALGVEMEGGGVAAAVRRACPDLDVLMIRGVADLANEQKRLDSAIWEAFACDTAAAFAVDTLRAVQLIEKA
jgi:nucleoside phosphorylase